MFFLLKELPKSQLKITRKKIFIFLGVFHYLVDKNLKYF